MQTETKPTSENLTDEQVEKLSKAIIGINAFMKNEKKLLTEEFFKDKTPLGKPIAEWHKIRAEFDALWEAKEKQLYAMITNEKMRNS